MSPLKTDILPYLDVYGLVAPALCSPLTQGCDNGMLHTADYYMLLHTRNELLPSDVLNWLKLVSKCFVVPGLLCRAPNDVAQDSVDNAYGVVAACAVLSEPSAAQDILSYGMSHWGFFNNTNPGAYKLDNGNIKWEAFLWHQPQLLFATLCAANKYNSYHPIHLLLSAYTALIIATSCMFTPPTQSTERRLCYMLIKATEKSSRLCAWASKVWMKRLYTTYSQGMKDVNAIYYQAHHPIVTYWTGS